MHRQETQVPPHLRDRCLVVIGCVHLRVELAHRLSDRKWKGKTRLSNGFILRTAVSVISLREHITVERVVIEETIEARGQTIPIEFTPLHPSLFPPLICCTLFPFTNTYVLLDQSTTPTS